MTATGITWLSEKIWGPPPLNLPMRQIHAGMLDEIEFNLDCLLSYEYASAEAPKVPFCQPHAQYTDSWFHHLAAVRSRDYYSDSERTFSDWEVAKRFYSGLDGVETASELADLEEATGTTLRDALFLTGYIRYFYRNFYERDLPKECQYFQPPSQSCAVEHQRLFGDAPGWQKQIDRWGSLPARRTVVDGEVVTRYEDWLGFND